MQAEKMLEEISRRLREVGVHASSPRKRLHYDGIFVLRASGPPNEMGLYNSDDVDQAEIWSVQNRWLFYYGKAIPGPGPHDFEYGVNTVEEIVTFTRHFFLGEPVMLDGWLAPLHRHPEWSEEAVRECIARAQPEWEPNRHTQPLVTNIPPGFQKLRSGRNLGFDMRDPAREEIWKQKDFALQAVALEPENLASTHMLSLRRDLSDAILYKDRHCPSCHHESLLRTGWTIDWQARYVCTRCGQLSQRHYHTIRSSL